MTEVPGSMGPSEYEKLTQLLVKRISEGAPVTTSRLDHNVVLPGRASPHQIDVLWEFTTGSGPAHRIIFECKHRSGALEQNDMLAFKGVVEEVGYESIPTTGVMVHLTGYQLGARKVADTYGLIILELRSPNDKDVEGRALGFRGLLSARVPVVKDMHLDVCELLSDALNEPVLNYGLQVETADGQRISIMALLQDGEIDLTKKELTSQHRVTRSFEPPAMLMVEGEPAARVRAVSAIVGEERGVPTNFAVGGRENLAWMLKNTLGGERAWFANDGKIYLSEF
jgi:hypothetical protein